MKPDGVALNGFEYTFRTKTPSGIVVAERKIHNLIPQVGLTFLQRSPFGDASPITTFYMGLFSNNYLPTSATTATDIPTTAGEFVGYSGSTRPLWDKTYNGTDTYDNEADPAQFVFTESKLIYGAFLVSVSTKSANSGTLLSMARFEEALDVASGLTLEVSAGLVYLPTA